MINGSRLGKSLFSVVKTSEGKLYSFKTILSTMLFFYVFLQVLCETSGQVTEDAFINPHIMLGSFMTVQV